MHQYYSLRRNKLLAIIEPESVVIIATNPQMKRSNDTFYPFRPNSNFIYFTGCLEPNSVMILSHTEYTLFLPPKDLQKELWDGEILGLEQASKQFECSTYDINTVTTQLPKLLKQYTKVYFDFDNIDTHLLASITCLAYESLRPLITPLRLIKDAPELLAMREAMRISTEAHMQAMKHINQCKYEYEVQSIFDAYFSRHHSEHAYYPIIAGGNNANTLHYIKNNKKLIQGELLLIDAGCEYHYYASDITRTLPINAQFSNEQAILYDLVLAVQLATIKQVAPGTTINKLDTLAKDIMTEQLLMLGIIKQKTQFKDFFPHGVGHFLGLDVHDMGSKDVVLEPNMVLTIEPGIYIPFNAKIDAKYNKFKGIGIRIEDDILVTNTGFEVLTKECPKERKHIEYLMQQ